MYEKKKNEKIFAFKFQALYLCRIVFPNNPVKDLGLENDNVLNNTTPPESSRDKGKVLVTNSTTLSEQHCCGLRRTELLLPFGAVSVLVLPERGLLCHAAKPCIWYAAQPKAC